MLKLESNYKTIQTFQKLTQQQNLLTRCLDLNSKDNQAEKACSSSCSSSGVHKTGGGSYSPHDIAGQCDSSCSSSVAVGSNSINVNPQSENNQSFSNGTEDNQGANATVLITETDARLIGVIATFLLPHPFGASLDYIWSYTQKVLPSVPANQIETLMTKFPTLFRQATSGVGATFERKWVFVGFNSGL